MAYHEIVWKPDYEIGIPEIDNQHKKLITIANKFLKAKYEGKAPEVLKQTFVDLIDYTKYHFQAEESTMQNASYRFTNEHKEQHKKLIDQIVKVLDRLKSGSINAVEDLAGLLKEWLLDHVIKEDKKFGELLHR